MPGETPTPGAGELGRESGARKSAIEQWAENSEASAETMAEAQKLVDGLPELPADPFQAAATIREHLEGKGWDYNAQSFRIQDVLKNKAGNCLGMTCLVGAAFESRGFRPEYRVVRNPRDTQHEQELKFFDELSTHGYASFNRDNPKLPTREHPKFRFQAHEHPLLFLRAVQRGDQRVDAYFEPTTIRKGRREEEIEIDLETEIDWKPNGESEEIVTYNELASNALVDQARLLYHHDRFSSIAEIQERLERGLATWPSNREAWKDYGEVGEAFFDDAAEQKGREQFERLNGKDARYFWGMYELTRDASYLDKALAVYPAYLAPFYEKNVARADTTTRDGLREARFNLGVAAWAASLSESIDLGHFYLEHSKDVIKLFGKEQLMTLLDTLKVRQRFPSEYHFGLYAATRDKTLAAKMLQKGKEALLPKKPKRLAATLLWARADKVAPEKVKTLWTDLERTYGDRKSFRELAAERH